MTASVVVGLLCMLAVGLAVPEYKNDYEGLIWYRKEHVIAAKEVCPIN